MKVSQIRSERGRNRTLFIGESSKFFDVTGVSQPKWWGYLWQFADKGYRTHVVVGVTKEIDYDVIILTQDDMGQLFDSNATIQTPTEILLNKISPSTQFLTGNFNLDMLSIKNLTKEIIYSLAFY